MTVIMAVVPLLEGETAKSFMKTLEESNLLPYSDAQRLYTNERIKEILAKRKKK